MEDNKKIKRVGSLTLAFTLIVFGITMILQMFMGFDSLRYILMLWPIAFILLGIEILVFNSKKDLQIKCDGASIFLIFVIIGISSLVGLANFGINQFLYNDTVKDALVENSSVNSYELGCAQQVNINNLSDKKIKLKIQEVNLESTNEMARVIINSDYNKEKTGILNLINNDFEYNSIIIERNEDGNGNIIITDIPEHINGYSITVLVSSKDKVSVNGNIDLVE